MVFICSFTDMNTRLLKHNNKQAKDYLNYGLLVQTFRQWIIGYLAYLPK